MYSAITGATAVGLLVGANSLSAFTELVSWKGLLQIVFLIVLSTGFLVPLHHKLTPASSNHDHQTMSQAAPKNRGGLYWVAVLAGSMLGIQIIDTVLHHTITHDIGAAALLGLMSTLTAGVATFYAVVAHQGKGPSMSGQALTSASVFGAVIMFPVALLIAINLGMVTESKAVLLSIPVAILLGAANVGIYAAAIEWAVESSSNESMVTKLFVTMVATAIVKITLIIGVLMTTLGYDRVFEILQWEDFVTEPACIVGWCVGLVLNPQFKHVFQKPETSS